MNITLPITTNEKVPRFSIGFSLPKSKISNTGMIKSIINVILLILFLLTFKFFIMIRFS